LTLFGFFVLQSSEKKKKVIFIFWKIHCCHFFLFFFLQWNFCVICLLFYIDGFMSMVRYWFTVVFQVALVDSDLSLLSVNHTENTV
jgi:hypothetical protein